jgi:hypothetical protein
MKLVLYNYKLIHLFSLPYCKGEYLLKSHDTALDENLIICLKIKRKTKEIVPNLEKIIYEI